MYKRFYFVDWIALNRHKAGLLPEIDLIVDGQRPTRPTWMSRRRAARRAGDDEPQLLPRAALVRAGPWGGQWIKEKIPQLPQDAVNYAWSFELIVPENGLLFESDGLLLEVSFDMLMFHDNRAVIGRVRRLFRVRVPHPL